MMINMTTNLQAALKRCPNQGDVLPVLGQAFHELGDFGQEPSMVFAGPDYPAREFDDDGRTILIPCSFAFWLKRDDYPADCDPAVREGGAVYTYMLPEDY